MDPEAGWPAVEFCCDALEAYEWEGAPGGEEPRRFALELALQLQSGAAGWGLPAPRRSSLHLSIAGLHIRLGELDAAIVEARAGLDDPALLPELGCELARLLAGLLRTREDYEAADAAIDQALGFLEHMEGTAEAAVVDELHVNCLAEKVRLLVNLARFEEAGPHAVEELAIARRMKARGERLEPLYLAIEDNLTQLMGSHQHDHALLLLEEFAEAGELPPGGSAQRIRLAYLEAVARLECAFKGRMPDAVAKHDPIELLESAIASEGLDELDLRDARSRLGRAYLDAGRTGDAENTLRVLRTQAPNLAEAPAIAALALNLEARIAFARAPVSLESLRDLLARTRSTWDAFLERWSSATAVREATGPLFHLERSNLASTLVELHLAVDATNGPRAALDDLLRAQRVGSLARALGSPGVDTATIQKELLLPDEVAVLHQPSHDGGFVILVTGESVSAHRLAPQHEFEDAQSEFDRALDRALRSTDARTWKAVDRASGRLFELLFPAGCRQTLAAHAPLALLASEILGYVPIEMLHGPDGTPLGLSHAIRYLPSGPSARALQLRRARRATTGKDAPGYVLFCADEPGRPAGLPFPGPLSVTDREKTDLGDGYPEERRHTVSGREATPERLAEECATHPRVLQVLAHGIVDDSREQPAGLLLAGDTPELWPERALELAAPPLVVLGACETWSGPRRPGDDGGTHLTGCLLRAGADTVIASQRPILRAWAIAFFTELQRSLAKGVPPAEALRAARVSFREHEDPRWRNMPLLVHAIGLADRPVR